MEKRRQAGIGESEACTVVDQRSAAVRTEDIAIGEDYTAPRSGHEQSFGPGAICTDLRISERNRSGTKRACNGGHSIGGIQQNSQSAGGCHASTASDDAAAAQSKEAIRAIAGRVNDD